MLTMVQSLRTGRAPGCDEDGDAVVILASG